MRILRVKVAYLFDVLGIDEDFAVDGLKLVGAWSEHLRNNVCSSHGGESFVAVLVALDKASTRSLT